jgi:conjugative transfer region protein TrbK
MTERRRSRGPWLILAAILLALIIAAAAIVASRSRPNDSPRFRVTDTDSTQKDAQASSNAELARCRALPPATEDTQCHEIWERSRRRFFEDE